MFQNIPPAMQARMKQLENTDTMDRQDGTPHHQRLRQISPETGRFLALLLAGAPDGAILEIGTSAGYSTLWLSLACAMHQRRIVTFELLPEKAKLAHNTFRQAGVDHLVQLVVGDAQELIPAYERIGFCFLDADKEIYTACYEALVSQLVPGGLLLADNAISHRQELQPMLEFALKDKRVDALIVPIGTGVLLCRKV